MACNQSWLELLDSSNSCPNDDNSKPSPTKPATKPSTQKIEIIESSNEKKYNKIFKRRLSNEKLPEVQAKVKVETPSRHKGKRSKIDAEYEENKEEPENENDEDYELEEGELERTLVTAKKRLRSESSDASSSNHSSNFQNREIETDSAILERRQKQIDYGKNTAGYDNYQKIPKQSRTRDHPKTPPKHLKYSRRAWEGLIKSWRKKLHQFDNEEDVVGEDDNATAF